MAKIVRCREVGMDCDFEARGTRHEGDEMISGYEIPIRTNRLGQGASGIGFRLFCTNRFPLPSRR